MRIAELLQRIVAEWKIPFSFYRQWKQGFSFQSKKNNKDDIAESDSDESDTNSVKIEGSEDDELGKMGGASSEVDNFDICEKDHQEAFIAWKCSRCFVHTLQLVVKVFETAPAHSRTIECIGYCEHVMYSNRAPDTASWKKGIKNAQPDGIRYFKS